MTSDERQDVESSNAVEREEAVARSNSKGTDKQYLSVVSKAYDRDGKGYLDDTEQLMRQMDTSNRGYLPNDTVYDLLKESVAMQKKMVTQRWIIILLCVFAVILALANMGTAFAAASLAKDTEVSEAPPQNTSPSASSASTAPELPALMKIKGENRAVATASKGQVFSVGNSVFLPIEQRERRNRKLRSLNMRFEVFEDSGHSVMDWQDVEALFFVISQGYSGNLYTKCGAAGQGRHNVEQVLSMTMTPYQTEVEGADGIATISQGVIYEVFVGGGFSNRALSGVGGERKRIVIDCEALTDEELVDPSPNYIYDGWNEFCIVSGTDCCTSWMNETTSEVQDNCPQYQTCACSCSCIEEGLLQAASCDPGYCSQTDPEFIWNQFGGGHANPDFVG